MLIVDRIEADYALCETDEKSIQVIPLLELPVHIAEGDVLCQNCGKWEIDAEETSRRRSQIAERSKRLRKKKDSSGV